MFAAFQEDIRKLSWTGLAKDDPFFYNGWSQVYAAKQLLTKYDIETFDEHEKELTTKLVALWNNFDITRNVRGAVKELLLQPYYPGFPDWAPYDNAELEAIIAGELSLKTHILKIVDGKLYLMLPKLSERLLDHIDNDEEPHITIINSNKFVPETHEPLAGMIITDVVYGGMAFTPVLDYPPFENVIVVKCRSETLREKFGKDEYHYTVKRTPREFIKFD